MPTKTIVDASIPNAGRIYDYLLGGHHNFEIDRQAGERVRELMPFLPKLMRLFRWCLHDIAHELTYERGYDTIIDFASGLPTEDHLHTAVKPGTTVIYSDRDAVCVEYAREILGSTSDVYYFQADCRYPTEFLSRPEIQEILNGNRRVAFVYWGISMYLSDTDIPQIVRELYDWSTDDSTLAFYLQPGDNMDSTDTGVSIQDIYAKMGDPLYFRPLEVFKELFKPWMVDSLGYRTMEEWHGVNSPLTAEDRQYLESGTTGYGAYLVKGK